MTDDKRRSGVAEVSRGQLRDPLRRGNRRALFKKRRSPVRAVDLDGVIRVQRSHSVVRPVSALTALDGLRLPGEQIPDGIEVVADDHDARRFQLQTGEGGTKRKAG